MRIYAQFVLSLMAALCVGCQQMLIPNGGCVPSSAYCSAAPNPQDLKKRLDTYLNKPAFSSALWGIHIVSLSDGKTLYAHHPDRLLIPASNTKIFTAATVLEQLGPDYRILTSVYGRGRLSHGRLYGDLIVWGRGDPSHGTALLDEVTLPFEQLAVQIKQRGLRDIEGDVVVDTRYFQEPIIGRGWEALDLSRAYAPEVSTVNLADNRIRLHIFAPSKVDQYPVTFTEPFEVSSPLVRHSLNLKSSVFPSLSLEQEPFSRTNYLLGRLGTRKEKVSFSMSMPHVAKNWGQGLREALQRHGIRIHGHIRVLAWPYPRPSKQEKEVWFPLAEINSPPLSDLVRAMMKHSSNLFGQSLFLHLGEDYRMRYGLTKEQKKSGQYSVLAIQNFLEDRVGLQRNQVWLEDGVGLSRKNLSSARALTQLLRYMDRSSVSQIFRESLPIAGVDGSLRKRLRGDLTRSRLWGKTGTLTHIRSLAGYLKLWNGEKLAYAVLLNNYIPEPGLPSANQAIDDVIKILFHNKH